ncbi:hypothetical protein BGX28_007218 [Mortierella sp. GBA30]|nr:hypothetical protein BGX28_007218 [Mortierella sp. GBA30]
MSLATRIPSVAGSFSASRQISGRGLLVPVAFPRKNCVSGAGSFRAMHQSFRSSESNHTLITCRNALLRPSPLSLLSSSRHKLSPSSTSIVSIQRALSTASSSTATTASEDDEPIQGTTPAYARHLLICSGTPAKEWAKKPELSDPYHNLLMSEVRGQEVKVNWVEDPSLETQTEQETLPSKGPRHDLILFPDNIKFLGIRYEAFRDLARYLAQHPVGTLRSTIEKMIADKSSCSSNSIKTELVPGSGEPITIELVREPSAVLVCVHGSRDCRCGDQGGDLYKILNDMVQATGLTNSVKIYGVSHIGGHKFAPNTIMYPSGDWHGRISVLDSTDAQKMLFDALANGGVAGGVREETADPVMLDNWRGRIGMNKEEQLKLYEQVLEKRKQRSSTSAQQEPQGLFSAPGEELYEDDGLKEQVNAVSVESDKILKDSSVSSDTSASAAESRKVKIVFETFQKVRTEIEAKVGERILDIVKDKDPSRHGVYQALECTCGGQLECATCHVYIEPPFSARLPPVSDAEEDMLEYAVGRKEEVSRLGCQIKIQPEMEGMVVKLPQY